MAGVVLVAAVLAGSAAAALLVDGATVDEQAQRLERPPRSLSVVAAGDWLPEAAVNLAAAGHAPPGVRFDHEPLLRPIAPIVAAADLAICHMETPIGPPGGAYGFVGRASNRRSLIVAPHEIAADLRRVGFDRCSTASNHSYDLGVAGIDSTLAALDAAGLSHTGTARSPAEAEIDVFDVRGVRVSHAAYALNSNTTWPADAWRLARARDAAVVRNDVAIARSRGAEIVIVSVHVFVEMTSRPDPADRALVEAFTAGGGVDLVVIHGPHVVQPVEVVNGAIVFWSLGNLVSGMGVWGRGKYSDARTLDGLLAAVRFTERTDGRFAADAGPVLTCQMVDGRVVHPGVAVVADPAAPTAVRSAARRCIDRSAPVVPGLR